MRFHTAATFLAQSLLPLAEMSNALSTESSKDRKKKLDDRDIKILQQPWSSFAVNKQQDEVEEGSINKNKPLLKAFQKNLRDIIKDKVRAPEQLEDIEDLKECSMTMENDLDSALGLIGDCGPDEKCVESELSKTGGVCLKMTAAIDADKRRRRMQYGSCTYDNFDPATATGEITCVYGEQCFTDTYCVIPTIIRTFDGGEQYESYTTCFEVTVGSENEICYGYAYDTLPDCFVEANGERCNSCVLYLCPGEPGQNSIPGAAFDCTNTVLGTAGNQCEGYSFLPGLNEPPAEPTTGAPTSTPAPTAPETLPPTGAPSVPTTPAPVTSAPVTAAPVTAAPVTAAPVSTSAPVPPAPTVTNNPPTTTSAASTKTRALVSAVAVVAVGVVAVVMA